MHQEWDGACQRCGKKTNVHSMSRFNTELCCMECLETEKRHPKYKEAEAAEHAAVKAGNYNFPGIGLPPELRKIF